jgi:glycogen debranching enzyme
MQRADGFVGHMIFWRQILPVRLTDVVQAQPSWQDLRPHMSALIQPPFAAQALLRLHEAGSDRVFLGELYARVRRYHEWLARNRDFDGDGLLTIVSPFESGMDWKASYDPAIRGAPGATPRRLFLSRYFWRTVAIDWHNFARGYDLARIRRRARFLVKDAGFNSAYALDREAMATLAPLAGDDPAPFLERRARVGAAILRLLHDERDEAFYDVQEPGARKLRVLTPTIFFPLALEEVGAELAERILERHFDDAREFATAAPLPTAAVSEPAFDPGASGYLWRGPTWALPNWFLYRALRRRGFGRRAERLRLALRRGVERSGFREYYDPFTGQGYGARDFTWSGLLTEML